MNLLEERTSNLRASLEKRKAEMQMLKGQHRSLLAKIGERKETSENLISARAILTEANRRSQIAVKARIEGLITLALQSVYEDPRLQFILDMNVKRNQCEAQMLVKEGDKEPYIPKDATGGGLLDVISFAARIVFYSMMPEKSRALLILDEPMKWTGALAVQAGNMIKEIAQQIGVQVIMVTHDAELFDIADRSWEIKRENDRSVVNLLSTGENVRPSVIRRIKVIPSVKVKDPTFVRRKRS
jgi:DNA repair ATPase RecN